MGVAPLKTFLNTGCYLKKWRIDRYLKKWRVDLEPKKVASAFFARKIAILSTKFWSNIFGCYPKCLRQCSGLFFFQFWKLCILGALVHQLLLYSCTAVQPVWAHKAPVRFMSLCIFLCLLSPFLPPTIIHVQCTCKYQKYCLWNV